jgi:hypothetical protein
MPSYLRGVANKRDKLTFVALNAQNLHFGWNAKDLASKAGVGADDLIALGHVTAEQMSAVSGGLAILGANSPRPQRMKKVINPGTTSADVQESVSTFVAYDAGAQALAAGWKYAGSGKLLPTVRQSGRTVTAAASVDFGGSTIGYYLFPMNASDAALAQIAALGLKFAGGTLSDAEIRKGFAGTSQPRPFKATLELEGGSTVSTFCSHDKVTDASAAGWSITGGVNPPVMNT